MSDKLEDFQNPLQALVFRFGCKRPRHSPAGIERIVGEFAAALEMPEILEDLLSILNRKSS